MDAVIFDVDGTLANVSPIRHYLIQPKGKKDFDSFHRESVNVEPNHDVASLARSFHSLGVPVLVVTARLAKWMEHTIWWMLLWDIPFDQVYMRQDNDFRPDFVIKEEILSMIRKEGYNPILCVDDNPAVIELWKSHDIPTITVPGWEVEQ